MTSLATLPGFLAYFATGIALLVAGAAAYHRITPYDELGLVRAGNAGAAIAFGGALVGLALPIASAFTHSVNLVDAAVWALVALLAQLGCFFGVTWLLGAGWREAVARGEIAGAILKGAAAIAVGLLNAACLST